MLPFSFLSFTTFTTFIFMWWGSDLDFAGIFRWADIFRWAGRHSLRVHIDKLIAPRRHNELAVNRLRAIGRCDSITTLARFQRVSFVRSTNHDCHLYPCATHKTYTLYLHSAKLLISKNRGFTHASYAVINNHSLSWLIDRLHLSTGAGVFFGSPLCKKPFDSSTIHTKAFRLKTPAQTFFNPGAECL